jgi:hypothetical protein
MISSPNQKQDSQKGIICFNLFLILGMVAVLGIYLAQYDGLISQDYEIRKCKKILSEQENLARELKVKMTELNSVDNLQGVAKDLNLVAAEKIKYLEVRDSAVAMSGNLSR